MEGVEEKLNEISFMNHDFTYVIKDHRFDVKDSKRLYNALVKNDGLLYLSYETSRGLNRINKFYLKCYRLSKEKEYPFVGNIDRVEIRFAFDYRKEYPIETAYCIELSFIIEDARIWLGYSNICINLLLDKDYKVISIDPCCNYDLIITRFLFAFELDEIRRVSSNEI